MLDKAFCKIVNPVLEPMSSLLIIYKVKPNYISLFGFFLSFISFTLIIFHCYILGLLFFILSRFFDGLDGAVAKKIGQTNFGGFLDIVLDFITYSLIPLGFIIANQSNSLAGSILLVSFFGTASSFLAFAIIFHKSNDQNINEKTFYHLEGLVGGSETIIFLSFMFLFPNYFNLIAIFFSIICVVATIERIVYGYKILK